MSEPIPGKQENQLEKWKTSYNFEDRFVQRAIAMNAPLLATSLYRYTQSEGITWAELAQRLNCELEDLNGVALCGPPRTETFVEDVRDIANDHVDFARLLSLLRQLQVLAILSSPEVKLTVTAQIPANEVNREEKREENVPISRSLLLAARDHEEIE